ncbi:hypothetical protein BDV96DRAFT_508432 [Lophiotrema nucula]|uniref:Uncharacterized protein n=1 Tax=Lophiotrema nucula TaxID=690887 RepID=A0A6A5YGN9_9PLEO|nr:hypothetical protein BDV96DRAFT_508432 [Lophiotrema nucula]
MAPLVPTLHVSALQSELNTLPHGKPRSPPLDLSQAPRKELVQYRCNVRAKDGGGPPKQGQRAVIVCDPVVRFYRVCQDGLMVETTAWEGWKDKHVGAELGER